MASRVLGFVRQVLIAGVIGAGGNPVADAFWAAFRLPNMFRRLFAEGAFQAAFIPLFQGKLVSTDGLEARRFAEEVMAGLLVILLTLTILVELAAPVFVHLVASGFADDSEKFDLTTLYLRIMFPYLACMSLVGLMSGILNSLDKFLAYAAAPLLLNICQIAALLYYADHGIETTGLALAIATTISGVLQLLLLLWAARRQGYLLGLRVPKWTPGVKRLVILGTPGFISAGAVQINLIIGTNIASQEPGAVSWLMNADQLYQLPLAVIGIALGVVLLPMLSRRVKAGDEAGAVNALNRSLEVSAILTFPAAMAFIIMAAPICDALFRGLATDALGLFGGRSSAFTQDDVIKTGAALAMFGFGLPAFVWHKVFSPAFFAREDTKTPMNFALTSIVINSVLALALFPRFGFLAVAFSTSVAAWVQVLLLGGTLARRRLFIPDKRLLLRAPMMVLASIAMGGFLIFAMKHIGFIASLTLDREWLATIAIAGLAAAFYGVLVLALGAMKISDYKAYVKARS